MLKCSFLVVCGVWWDLCGGVVPHGHVLDTCVYYRDAFAVRVGPPVPLLHPMCILQMSFSTEVCLLLLLGVAVRPILGFLNWLNFLRPIQTLQVILLLYALMSLAGGRICLSM